MDLDRDLAHISGTKVRDNPYAHFDYLHPVVQSFHMEDYAEKVVFMGAESTEKSTLTRAMAAEYDTTYVPEYGDFLFQEKHGQLDYGDLKQITITHRDLENNVGECRNYLFVDTNAITTGFYSYFYFGRCDDLVRKYAAECRDRYQHVFLCEPDIPFERKGRPHMETSWLASIRNLLDPLQQRLLPRSVLTPQLQDGMRGLK